jgi:hypothetical protein
MQKLKGISSGQNNKSCRINYHESNKISDFSVIFYAIYKKQQNHYTIGVALLQERPWEDFYFCNVAPVARAAVLFAGIGRARQRSWPGEDGGGARGG